MTEKKLHLRNFFGRLCLEHYLEREFLSKLPFLLSFGFLIAILVLEHQNGSLFDIHSNISNALSLSSVPSVTNVAGIYSILTGTVLAKLPNLDPLDSSFINVATTYGEITMSQIAPFPGTTILLGTPVMYAIRGTDN